MKLNLFKKKELTDEEKKNKAKIQLVIFLVFIAFVFAYSKVLVVKNNHNLISKEEFINKIDLSTINKYDFEIKLNVDNEVYLYSGNVDNGNGTINGYKIVNGEYYNEKLEKIDNVFPNIDNKYFNLNTISSYILEYNYKNNRYEVHTNDIINNALVDIIIYANVTYNEDNVVINIDYSNLGHAKDSNINSYKVEYIISNYK